MKSAEKVAVTLSKSMYWRSQSTTIPFGSVIVIDGYFLSLWLMCQTFDGTDWMNWNDVGFAAISRTVLSINIVVAFPPWLIVTFIVRLNLL